MRLYLTKAKTDAPWSKEKIKRAMRIGTWPCIHGPDQRRKRKLPAGAQEPGVKV